MSDLAQTATQQSLSPEAITLGLAGLLCMFGAVGYGLRGKRRKNPDAVSSACGVSLGLYGLGGGGLVLAMAETGALAAVMGASILVTLAGALLVLALPDAQRSGPRGAGDSESWLSGGSQPRQAPQGSDD